MAETLRFDTAPGLPRLFAGALVNGRFGGSSLPMVTAERHGVHVAAAAVADYAHLCGFGLGAHPPVTWPHLLGFPLQAAVMSRRDFPLAMVGLVHVENRITWTRAARLWRVARRRRPRQRSAPPPTGPARGPRRRSVVGRRRRVARREHYLERGEGDDSATSDAPPDVADLVPRAVTRLRFGEDAGRRYAAVSGDVNPIHLHALSARAFGFPRAIAHGMFSYARVLASLGARLPDAGSSTVWFRKPVTLPSTATLAVSDDARLAVLVPARGGGEHLVATITPA